MELEECSAESRCYLIECFLPKLQKLLQPLRLLPFLRITLSAEERQHLEKYEERYGKDRTVRLLFDKIKGKVGEPGCFAELIMALRETRQLHVAAYLTADSDDCVRILSPEEENNYDVEVELIQLLAPKIIKEMKYYDVMMEMHDVFDEEDINEILVESEIMANFKFLAILVRKPPGWFDKFIKALYNTGHRELAIYLQGSDIGSNQTDNKPESASEPVSTQDPSDVTLQAKDLQENCRAGNIATCSLNNDLNSAVNFIGDITPKTEKMCVEPSWNVSQKAQDAASSSNEIPMRNYQLEVAQPALQGENVIICLPTGSGKTRVAVYITQHHLNKLQGKGKVIVLVNRVALVDQLSKDEFKPNLKDYNVQVMSGCNPLKVPLDNIVTQCDVIICTAQILENALSNLNNEDNEGINISAFTLLVIDECHHTQKDAVYNKIMCRYLEEKLKNKNKHLPQVLGFTASPGVGGATKQKEADTHVLKICANLDANSIKTVQQHSEELHKTVKIPKKNMKVTEERKEDPFGDKLKALMNDIHKHMEEFSNSEFGSQGYEQWLVEQEKKGALDTNRDLRACALHLRKYNDALLMKSTIRMVDAFNHLQTFYVEEAKKEDKCNETEKFLLKLFDDNKDTLKTIASNVCYENPNLKKLQEAVLQGFRQAESSRGIIFTKTRQSAQALWQWVNSNESLRAAGMRAHFLIGAGPSNQLKHMTQNEQQDVINKFRTGQLNLLVSTTVAEEGLNIKECNFVIRYSLVTNETAMVQARGRARADDSTYTLVAMEGTGVVERESTNIYREKMMHKAIKNVQSMKREDYLKKVKELQWLTIHERVTKERQKKINCKTVPARDVIFHCRHCNEKACSATDIRIIENMHHVNIQEIFKYGTSSGENNVGGRIFCPSCKSAWGSSMQFMGERLPCLSIENFLLRISNGNPTLYDTWMEIPCQVKSFSVSEYVAKKQNSE